SVLGDFLSTGLGVLGLSWQSSPALSELEEVVCDWMRQMVGLSREFRGVIQDTASTSTLVALICARERSSGYALAGEGMQGEHPPRALSAPPETPAAVEKAPPPAGFGRSPVRKTPVDDRRAMRLDALDEAITRDLAACLRPCAIVGTTGTTTTTALDPV